jgi:sulfate anion transporter 2
MLHLKLPMRVGMGKLIYSWIDIFSNIHKSNPGDVIVGVICMAVLLSVKVR